MQCSSHLSLSQRASRVQGSRAARPFGVHQQQQRSTQRLAFSGARSSSSRSTFAPAAGVLSRRAAGMSMVALAAAAGGAADAAASHDLLIVGPGVLGSYLGKLWKDAYPGARVVGLTNTTNSHDRCVWCMGLPACFSLSAHAHCMGMRWAATMACMQVLMQKCCCMVTTALLPHRVARP